MGFGSLNVKIGLELSKNTLSGIRSLQSAKGFLWPNGIRRQVRMQILCKRREFLTGVAALLTLVNTLVCERTPLNNWLFGSPFINQIRFTDLNDETATMRIGRP